MVILCVKPRDPQLIQPKDPHSLWMNRSRDSWECMKTASKIVTLTTVDIDFPLELSVGETVDPG